MEKIILISAKAQHGKDTLASYMQDYMESHDFECVTTRYASHIKRILTEYYGWNGIKDEWARNKLQWMGTEKIREEMNNPNFHVNRTAEEIEIVQDDFDFFFIPDTRFKNEIIEMRNKFGRENIVVIRVIRTDFESTLTEEQQNHQSEIALDDWTDWDYIITAKNLTELSNQGEKICNEIIKNI